MMCGQYNSISTVLERESSPRMPLSEIVIRSIPYMPNYTFFFPPSLGQRLTQIKMGDGNLTKEPSRFTQIAPAIKLYFSIVLCHSCTDIEKLTVFQRGKRVFLMFCRVTQFEEHCGSPDTWVHTVPSALLCGRSNFEAF